MYTQQEQGKDFITIHSFSHWGLKQHTSFSSEFCYTWYFLKESNAAATPPTLCPANPAARAEQ